MAAVEMTIMKVMLAVAIMPCWFFSLAVDISHLRQLAAQNNVTCILVFGDSSVDPGNNNVLQTAMKSNFPPYGKDFFDSRPTGRFSNGRLAPDFIAEALLNRKTVPAFLDLNLKLADMPHGVSFASAASVSKQLEYFEHYKMNMKRLVGQERAEFIIRNALYVISMGTNDFLQNYYLVPTRPKQFSLQQFQNFLLSRMSRDIEVMHRLGASRFVVVGVPPLGCMPFVKTLMNQRNCVTSLNRVAYSFNTKVQKQLANMKAKLGLKTAYIDAYAIIKSAEMNPEKSGFVEVSKGCCGTGTIEYGNLCKGMSTCSDATKYLFWDAIHPTEKMYKSIAFEALELFARALAEWQNQKV